MTTPSDKIPESGGSKAVRDAFKTLVFFIRIGVFLLIGAFLFSGMVNLEKNETAVIFRFGAESENQLTKPGYKPAFPYPIDEVVKIRTGELMQLESKSFWYSKEINTKANALVPGNDGYLLTADHNIIHSKYTLKYLVSDPRAFIFAAETNKQKLKMIRTLADNTLLKLVAGMPMEQALKGNEVNEIFRNRLQIHADAATLGIKIESISFSGLEVSPLLKEKLEALNSATQEQEKLSSKARIYSTRITGEAVSTKDRMISIAKTTADEKISRSRHRAGILKQLLAQHKGDIKAVKEHLLRQAMPKILLSSEELFLMNDHDQRQLDLILKRRPNEQVERELAEEEAKRRQNDEDNK